MCRPYSDATVSVQSERTIIELLPYGAVRSSHGGEFDGFLDTARGSAPGTLARGSESSPGTLSTAAEAQPNKPYRATTAADRGGKGIDDDRDDALTAECLADQPTLAPPSTGDDTAVHLTHIINPFATTVRAELEPTLTDPTALLLSPAWIISEN